MLLFVDDNDSLCYAIIPVQYVQWVIDCDQMRISFLRLMFRNVTWWTIMSNAVGWYIFTCTLLLSWNPQIADAHLLQSPAKNFEDKVHHFNGLTFNPISNCANWNRLLFSIWDLQEQTYCLFTYCFTYISSKCIPFTTGSEGKSFWLQLSLISWCFSLCTSVGCYSYASRLYS